jgi:hypothetical protein
VTHPADRLLLAALAAGLAVTAAVSVLNRHTAQLGLTTFQGRHHASTGLKG